MFFIFIFVPETHKKQLQEIQDYFKHHAIYILSKGKAIKLEVDEEAGEEMLKKKDVSWPKAKAIWKLSRKVCYFSLPQVWNLVI